MQSVAVEAMGRASMGRDWGHLGMGWVDAKALMARVKASMEAKDVAVARASALTGKVALMEKGGMMEKALAASDLTGKALAKKVALAKGTFDQAGGKVADF